jgi:hypothetical protein
MYLPPADAVIMNNVALRELNNGKDPTYAQYRMMEKELLAYSALLDTQAQAQAHMRGSIINGTRAFLPVSLSKYSAHFDEFQQKRYNSLRDQILPAACGVPVMASAGASDPYGKMISVHSSSTACTTDGGSAGAYCWTQCVALSTVSPPCNASAIECVDTSHNNVVVDGNDHCPGVSLASSCQLMCMTTPSKAPSSPPSQYTSPTASPVQSSSSSVWFRDVHTRATTICIYSLFIGLVSASLLI